MVYRFVFSCWSIVPVPGWKLEVGTTGIDGRRSDHVKIVPPGGDATLVMTPGCRAELGDLEPDRWIKICTLIDRKKGRPVESVRFGGLAGRRVEFLSVDEWIRGWSLHDGANPFHICYWCPHRLAGRDDVVVECMLNSLRPETDR